MMIKYHHKSVVNATLIFVRCPLSLARACFSTPTGAIQTVNLLPVAKSLKNSVAY